MGTIADAQSLNRFAFVSGNPVSYADPWGLERDPVWGKWDMSPLGPPWPPEYGNSIWKDPNVNMFSNCYAYALNCPNDGIIYVASKVKTYTSQRYNAITDTMKCNFL